MVYVYAYIYAPHHKKTTIFWKIVIFYHVYCARLFATWSCFSTPAYKQNRLYSIRTAKAVSFLRFRRFDVTSIGPQNLVSWPPKRKYMGLVWEQPNTVISHKKEENVFKGQFHIKLYIWCIKTETCICVDWGVRGLRGSPRGGQGPPRTRRRRIFRTKHA